MDIIIISLNGVWHYNMIMNLSFYITDLSGIPQTVHLFHSDLVLQLQTECTID